MDLTTLTYAFIIVIGLLGLDAALHPPDAILEAEAIGSFEKTAINASLVDDVLNQEVRRISATPTLMTKPAIQVGRLEGLAMSLAEAAKMQTVAYALQSQLGFRPDLIKISLYGENGSARALVTGTMRQRAASFQQQVTLEPNETVVELLQRATMIGMAHVDPYITALSEVQGHADDRNFANAETIIRFAMAGLPPKPVSFERALFENLNGLIALFRNDARSAKQWFERAEASCPDGTVADAITSINVAFAQVQLDQDRDAADHIQALLSRKPPADKILLSTAYMTAAAAQLSLHDVAGADRFIAQAIATYPEASGAYDLWADIKREAGDEAAADRLHLKAMENSGQFENYGEVAMLYFRVAWRNEQPVMRSPFSNPVLGKYSRLLTIGEPMRIDPDQGHLRRDVASER